MSLKKVSTLRGAHYLSICLILVVGALWWVNSGMNYGILVLNDYFSKETIFQKQVKFGDEFTLAYIHSVTKQPVFEVYTITESFTISLLEMRYDSFGPNLPSGPEKLAGETTKFIVEEGYYKIIYENRQFEQLLLRTGQMVADHSLIFSDGVQVRLLDLVAGGSLLEFQVMPKPLGIVTGKGGR